MATNGGERTMTSLAQKTKALAGGPGSDHRLKKCCTGFELAIWAKRQQRLARRRDDGSRGRRKRLLPADIEIPTVAP